MPTDHELVVNSGIAVVIIIDNIKPQANDIDVSVLPTTAVTVHDEV